MRSLRGGNCRRVHTDDMRRVGLASLMTVLLVLPVACSAQAVPRVLSAENVRCS